MLSDEEVDEIHYISETQTIDEVPESASEDESETRLGRRVGDRRSKLEEENQDDGQHRDGGEDDRPVRVREIVEQAEQGPPIGDQGQVQETRDDRGGRIERHARGNPLLAQLVEDQDGDGDGDVAGVRP